MWCKFHESLLKKWSEICFIYSIMHTKSEIFYTWITIILGIPLIIIGALSSSAIFANSSIKSDVINYISGGLVLTLTILTGIKQFFNSAERAKNHNDHGVKYRSINLEIDELLACPRRNREISPQEFLPNIRKRMEELQSTSPKIPMYLLNRYIQFRKMSRKTEINYRETFKTESRSNSRDVSEEIVEIDTDDEQEIVQDITGGREFARMVTIQEGLEERDDKKKS